MTRPLTLRTGRPSLAVAVIAALVASTPSFADTAPSNTKTNATATKETSLQRIQKSVAKLNAEASTPEGEAAVVIRLSTQLAVPADSLRQQRIDWGVGYGEVAMVHGFKRASKKPVTPSQIVEMRRSGMEWDKIAKDLGVKVDTVASKMNKHVGPKPTPHPK